MFLSYPNKKVVHALRSCWGNSVAVGKICIFCGNCSICSGKCVSIVVKLKCVNSGNMNDICDKLNFTKNYTHYPIYTYFITKNTDITIFNTYNGTVSLWNLSISTSCGWRKGPSDSYPFKNKNKTRTHLPFLFFFFIKLKHIFWYILKCK